MLPPGFERDHWFVLVSPNQLCAEPRELLVNALACLPSLLIPHASSRIQSALDLSAQQLLVQAPSAEEHLVQRGFDVRQVQGPVRTGPEPVLR